MNINDCFTCNGLRELFKTSTLKFVAIMLLWFVIFSCNERKPDSAENHDEDGWALLGFEKADSLNPILKPTPELTFNCPVSKKTTHWEERNVLNPAAVVKDGKVYLIYRAQDNNMTSRLGLAISDDGLHFVKQPEPIFFPAEDEMKKYEWNGGVEDPRIVQSEDGRYVLTYTSYDGKTARLCIASSADLKSWTKHGPAFNEEYSNSWSKSGAIVVKRIDDRMVAAKIGGRYWMYFGDTDIFIASSIDLIHWEVAINDESKKMISVLNPRPGYFDSRLVEPGPYALLQDDGVLLIYNGSNALNFNDGSLPKFTYSASQALFDKNHPYKMLARLDSSFIHPDKAYERIGEVNEVCFVEGLVYFRNKWFLYYGTADSKIAVAVKTK